MSDVLMYDGINSLAAGIARQFPQAAKVAGYVGGLYAWSQADWDLFPHADKVRIAVRASTDDGDVLDVEQGDATPDQAAGWIAMRHAAGLYRPTIYCSRLVIPAVRQRTGSYILGRDYDIWVADYTGQPHQVAAPGLPAAMCAATQYESTADWDASAVYDPGWPHRQPAQPAPVIPAPGGTSATPHEYANLSWLPVPGADHYRYQVRYKDGSIKQWLTSGTHAGDVPLDGRDAWRVQAGGGAWTAWLPIG